MQTAMDLCYQKLPYFKLHYKQYSVSIIIYIYI